MKTASQASESVQAHLASASVAICGLARDCAATLPSNRSLIEELRSCFSRSVVAVVENDSKDSTREQLELWAKECDNVFILDGHKPKTASSYANVNLTANPYFSFSRVNKLASLRNQYITFLHDTGFSFDYLLVLDFDVSQISFTGVIDSFQKRDAWDVVTAYGYSLSPLLRERYHDSFALVPLGDQLSVKTESSIKQLQARFALDRTSDLLIPVAAAFGGLSIYKTKGRPLPFYKAEYNQDLRVEAVCEHVSFAAYFVLSADSGVKINPRMHLRYQTVLDSLKRKLSNSLKKAAAE